jgi:excisionase family DNA binding protein
VTNEAAILAALERLERKVDALARERSGRPLSLRQAAQGLGVDRSHLAELVRAKAIRTVEVRGAVRIPAAEVQRLQAEGVPAAPPPRTRRAKDDAAPAAIGDISVD